MTIAGRQLKDRLAVAKAKIDRHVITKESRLIVRLAKIDRDRTTQIQRTGLLRGIIGISALEIKGKYTTPFRSRLLEQKTLGHRAISGELDRLLGLRVVCDLIVDQPALPVRGIIIPERTGTGCLPLSAHTSRRNKKDPNRRQPDNHTEKNRRTHWAEVPKTRIDSPADCIPSLKQVTATRGEIRRIVLGKPRAFIASIRFDKICEGSP